MARHMARKTKVAKYLLITCFSISMLLPARWRFGGAVKIPKKGVGDYFSVKGKLNNKQKFLCNH